MSEAIKQFLAVLDASPGPTVQFNKDAPVIKALRDAGAPVNAEALHAECKRVAHNAIHDAIYKIDDCEPVKDAVRDALDSIDLSEFAVAQASEGTFEKSYNRAIERLVMAQKHMSREQRDAFDAEWKAWKVLNPTP